MNELGTRRADFRRAARMADRGETDLRAGDAPHLAIAADRGLKICAWDAGLARAAATLGCGHELN
ncbi:hypothetical protein KX816_19375 [Sphingosinicellaceae bacterium]|nr:hypothetical protein KX816_19375 [Sphingosinicellaceae bacterium]